MMNLKQKLTDKLGEQRAERLLSRLRTVRAVKNIVCWVLIAVISLGIIVFMITRFSGGTPSVFGYSLHRVVSESMVPELEVGDVIINRDVHDPAELSAGDIVTFSGVERFENQEVTHRVLIAPYDDGAGNLILVTKGDANLTDDGDIPFSAVESKLVHKSAFLKNVYNFFFSPWGLAIFLALLLLIFIEEIVSLFRVGLHRARQEDDEETFLEVYRRLQREEKKNRKKNKKKRSAKGAPFYPTKKKKKKSKRKTKRKISRNTKKRQKKR